jgi:hypothetical protein
MAGQVRARGLRRRDIRGVPSSIIATAQFWLPRARRDLQVHACTPQRNTSASTRDLDWRQASSSQILGVVRRELIEAINLVTTTAIATDRLPAEEQVEGVRALDLWKDGPHGAMLFWADASADLNGQREPVLCDVYARHTRGIWTAAGGGSASSGPLEGLTTHLPPGLHSLGRTSFDEVFLWWAIATPEVATIRLSDDSGNVRERPPGRHGLTLLGVSSKQPLTSAYAIDRTGRQVCPEPLTLWAPPRD